MVQVRDAAASQSSKVRLLAGPSSCSGPNLSTASALATQEVAGSRHSAKRWTRLGAETAVKVSAKFKSRKACSRTACAAECVRYGIRKSDTHFDLYSALRFPVWQGPVVGNSLQQGSLGTQHYSSRDPLPPGSNHRSYNCSGPHHPPFTLMRSPSHSH